VSDEASFTAPRLQAGSDPMNPKVSAFLFAGLSLICAYLTFTALLDPHPQFVATLGIATFYAGREALRRLRPSPLAPKPTPTIERTNTVKLTIPSVLFAVLAAFLAYMTVFSVVGDSPDDEPSLRLVVVFGIGSFYAARAAYRRAVVGAQPTRRQD